MDTSPGNLPSYEHRQRAGWLLALLLVGALAAGVGAAVLASRSSPAAVTLGIVAAVVLGVASQFHVLTVRVAKDAVTVLFGAGWIRRRVAMTEIRDVQPVRNAWWNGWGIRWIPRGWLWNVWGLDAVQIDLPEGRRLRIGTDEPAALAEAIRQHLPRP